MQPIFTLTILALSGVLSVSVSAKASAHELSGFWVEPAPLEGVELSRREELVRNAVREFELAQLPLPDVEMESASGLSTQEIVQFWDMLAAVSACDSLNRSMGTLGAPRSGNTLSRLLVASHHWPDTACKATFRQTIIDEGRE